MTGDTRARLIEAARACLLTEGHAQLSTRRIAAQAGVPLSQIHYHFGGRDGLVLALLAHQNDQLLHRQRLMFGTDEPLWKRYERACDFLERDLDSGYVRILHEMIAAGWADDVIGAEVSKLLRGWFDLLEGVVAEAEEVPGKLGSRELSTLIGLCFIGGESVVLLDPSRRGDVLTALRSVGALLTGALPQAAAPGAGGAQGGEPLPRA